MADRTPEEIRDLITKQLNSPIVEALENEGITPSYLAKLLKKELKAKEVKVFNDKGIVIYSDPLKALDIMQKARQDAHKLRGDYAAEKHEVTTNPRSPAERKELMKIAKEMAEKIRNDKKSK